VDQVEHNTIGENCGGDLVAAPIGAPQFVSVLARAPDPWTRQARLRSR